MPPLQSTVFKLDHVVDEFLGTSLFSGNTQNIQTDDIKCTLSVRKHDCCYTRSQKHIQSICSYIADYKINQRWKLHNQQRRAQRATQK